MASKSPAPLKTAKKAPVRAKTAKSAKTTKSAKTATRRTTSKPVRLLSGGNPQIAKGDGDAPVQAYIAAMPGWKSAVGQRLDALIVKAVPRVQKAVKWNSPMYGVGQGFFLGIHTYARYVKIAFFRGRELDPLPPGPSKSGDVRYLDIREDEELDAAQFTKWVKQAAKLPGWVP